MAFGFPNFQFSAHDSCCQARFDLAVRVPEATTNEQFDRMLQNLLRERFKLAFHYERKEMAIYELALSTKGPKMSESLPSTPGQSDEHWWIPHVTVKRVGEDGYPVFVAGREGVANGSLGHMRWTAFSVSTEYIARALSDQLGRPVVDTTGLKGKYDVDLKWFVDIVSQLGEVKKAELEAQVGKLPEDSGSGPALVRSVEDQLGLKLVSKKGFAGKEW